MKITLLDQFRTLCAKKVLIKGYYENIFDGYWKS